MKGKFMATVILMVLTLSSFAQQGIAGARSEHGLFLQEKNLDLISKGSLMAMMGIGSIKSLLKDLDKMRIHITEKVRDASRRTKALADMRKIFPAIAKAKELRRAMDRQEEVKRNYGDRHAALTKQTNKYVQRTKDELFKKLLIFLGSKSRIEEAMK